MKKLMMVSFLLIHGVITCSSGNTSTFIYNQIMREGFNAVSSGDETLGIKLLDKGKLYDRFKYCKNFDKLVDAVVAGKMEEENKLVFQCMDEQIQK